MIKVLAGLIVLSLIGIAAFFTFRSDKLADKQFTVGTRKFSVMVPKNHIGKSSDSAFISVGKGKIISVALNLVERKSSRTITCNDLKTQTAFLVFNKYFDKEVEVCTSTLNEKGVELVMLDTPQLTDQNYTYALAMGIRGDYFATTEGKDKAKLIFESFKIIE